jgi:Ca2+/Na+ antiporter
VFYFISTLAILLFGLGGEVTWWEAVILLLIYVSLVVVVVLQEKRINKEDIELLE